MQQNESTCAKYRCIYRIVIKYPTYNLWILNIFSTAMHSKTSYIYSILHMYMYCICTCNFNLGMERVIISCFPAATKQQLVPSPVPG